MNHNHQVIIVKVCFAVLTGFLLFTIFCSFHSLCFLFLWRTAFWFVLLFAVLGETLKEKQAPRAGLKLSSSSSRLRDFKATVSNMIHNRPSQASQTTQSLHHVGSAVDQTEIKPLSSLAVQPRDWDLENSNEAKSGLSCRYRPTWRPTREPLNVDSIFRSEKRIIPTYSPLSPFSEDCGKLCFFLLFCTLHFFSLYLLINYSYTAQV